MNNSKQRKVGAILSYISIFASTAVQLLYTPFLISKLGQSEYGLYSLVSSIIGYLTILDLGFGNAIVVHTAKYRALGEKKKEQVLHGMFRRIYTGIGLIAGIAGVILALCSSSIFGATMSSYELDQMKIMLLILSFNLLITFAFSIYNSIIVANEKFIFQKIMAIFGTVAKPLLMLPILFMGYKSVALCFVITFINIVILLSNYVFCKKKLQVSTKFMGYDKKLFKTIFAYSFWIFLTQIVDKINWSADQFILGAVSGTVTVSVYSAAATLNTLFINLSTAISGVMLPKMSKMISKNATSKELTNEFVKVGRIQYFIIFLMASGLVIFGRQFIKLWLGDGFEETYRVALILIIPLCFPLVQNLGLSIMQAMNRYKFKAISTFIMSLFNIVMSVFLAKAFGATGAAIGTAVALIICNIIIINIYYYKVIKLNIFKFWKNIVGLTLLLVIPAVIAALIMNYVSITGWASLALSIICYVLVFAIYSYILCTNKYEKEIVKKIIMRAKRGKNEYKK